MKHRKFQQRLDELVAELTHAQAKKLIAALQERGDGDEVQRLLNQRLEDAAECPHCGSKRVEGWGRERNGLKRCRCLECKRTFNPLTGTPLAKLRKKERWLSYAGALNAALPVRKAAKACKINKNTAFKWRHRFLEALNYSKDQSLAGIAEVDEIFLLESFKGQRTLPRAARKRGGVAAKPGLSAEQIPVLIARNRAGSHIDAVLPDRSEAAVRPVLEGKLSKKDTLLCMDGDKALIAFAEAEESNTSSSSPARANTCMRPCCTSRTSTPMAAGSSSGSSASTASQPNICKAIWAGGAGWKTGRTLLPRKPPWRRPSVEANAELRQSLYDWPMHRPASGIAMPGRHWSAGGVPSP